MNLIYLWVEKYKNIENQGFNFSPKFNCEYDSENNELKIEENKNYLNLFPENINITAIVGKNGSGKSNLVKSLFELIYLYIFKEEDKKKNENIDISLAEYEEEYYRKLDKLTYSFENNKFFLIIKNKNKFFKIDSEYIKLFFHNSEKYKEFELFYKNKKIENFDNNFDNFSIYYNYSLDSWQDGSNSWIENIYHKSDDYKTPLLLEPFKKDSKIDLNLLKYLTNQRTLLFYSFMKEKLLNDEKITSFFNPNKIKFKYAEYNKKLEQEELKKGEKPFQGEFSLYKILIKYTDFINGVNVEDLENHPHQEPFSYNTSYEIKEIIEKFYKDKNYKSLNLLYLLFKMIEKKEKLKIYGIELEDYKEKLKIIQEVDKFEELLEKFENFVNDKELLNKLDENNFEIKKIVVALKFHQNGLYDKLKKIEKDEIQIKDLDVGNKEDIIYYFPAWLDVEFYENDKSLTSLSTGEKFKFEFLIDILYQLYNLNQKKEYNVINLFFDEIEMGFHPEWQKDYIKEIIYTLDNFKNKLENFNKQINLFFLTHSPFIISDLPKQNIIFLDKDENGKCKVVDGLKEKKETFGANIHTLLSDGFFMEKGFIGKFAENKINEVIKYLNEDDKSEIKNDKEAQNIVNIIGEPIIKKELQRMLDSRRLKKVDEIDIIKSEIELLKHRLEDLENEKNSNK